MAGQRLAKSSLLRKSWEFEAVYREGKRLRGAGFTLIYRPTTTGRSRLGISIHRGLRGVVKRNRIKRIVRESYRLEGEHYPRGADIVFVVRPDFACSCPHEISRAVSSHHGIS